jgi:hypothetical protein
MSKKKFGVIYWGNGLAPIDCQYKIKSNLNRSSFRRFLNEIKADGIYYNHGCTDGKWWVTVAFEDEQQMKAHAFALEQQAKHGGVFIKSN